MSSEQNRERDPDDSFDKKSVFISFNTVADLHQGEMTDGDWITLGKFVAEVAADARAIADRS